LVLLMPIVRLFTPYVPFAVAGLTPLLITAFIAHGEDEQFEIVVLPLPQEPAVQAVAPFQLLVLHMVYVCAKETKQIDTNPTDKANLDINRDFKIKATTKVINCFLLHFC